MNNAPANRIALAYSGGLDTSVMIPWLREHRGAEVVAVVADVGQGDDLEAVRRKALASGAVEARVVDLRREFVEEFVAPALRAGAVYEGRYLLGTALARPVIARAQVKVARETGCDALAHGCTGKGNDQVRFESAYGVLAPEMEVVAPWREWEITSREEAMEYAREHGIPVPASPGRPYSVDRNLWHTSYEGGVLEDPARPAPGDLCGRTADPRSAAAEPDAVRIRFREGVPEALDGEALAPLELVEALDERAARHGVGRSDLVENRVVGMKSRGVYETPAGTVLHAALRDLEAITLDRDTARMKERVAARYADLVYDGKWFSPLREALDAFVASAVSRVTGTVEVELFRGAARPVARSSPCSLYDEELATFGDDGVYDQGDASGFIRLWTLPDRVHARVHRRPSPAPGAASPGGGA
jgi:argininosuccinate synthase